MVKLRIASPCSADWNLMQGTDSVRYCAECKLNVYNFSEMSPAEIEALVAAKTDRLCARFYQRADGTMLTQNCPVGFRGAILRATSLASASLSAFIAFSHAKPSMAQTQSAQAVQIQRAATGLKIEVLDPSGAVIPNAKISVVNEKTQASFDTLTNEVGEAIFQLVPTSPYSITISAPGFAVQKFAHLEGPTSLTVRVFQMNLAVMGEIVEVPLDAQLETAPTPAVLTMPLQSDIPKIAGPKDNRNALQRLFAKLRRIL